MFGLGGSKSSTTSTSNAQSTDFSQGTSFGQSSQGVFGGDIFQQLYGGAMGATGKVAAGLPAFQGEAASLFSGGKDFLSSLQGDAGTNYMTSRLGGNDDILSQQIAGLSGDLGKFYNEQLLPGISSDSIQNGMLGGGRQGVAEGVAAGEVARQFQQGITGLRSANQAQKDTIAGNLTAAKTNQANVGLSGLSGVLGISQAGLSANILPQQLLAQILGDKTTLTSSLEGSQNTAEGQSTASSKSKGKSGGFNFSTSGAFGG
jgi:hypothetical protein